MIGDPVRHSISPAMHNAAYRELGMDWVYVAFPVPSGKGAAAVDAMRVLGLAGLSVTMPHKAAVVERLDRLAPTAARLGVVNTITRQPTENGYELVGDSTDGKAFVAALKEEGFDPLGHCCVVLGAGGAARAVTLALADSGAARVDVAARRPDQALGCAKLAGPAGGALPPPGDQPPGGSSSGGASPASIEEAIRDAALVVNATPVGMAPGDGLPLGINPAWLEPGQVVVDLIYQPAVTPLLTAARARGAFTANGLSMLIHQAAAQVELWTGRPAPLEAMSAAALAAIGQHRRA